MVSKLNINLFDVYRLTLNNEPVVRLISVKSQALLAYIAKKFVDSKRY